jgi:hypothetical protein
VGDSMTGLDMNPSLNGRPWVRCHAHRDQKAYYSIFDTSITLQVSIAARFSISADTGVSAAGDSRADPRASVASATQELVTGGSQHSELTELLRFGTQLCNIGKRGLILDGWTARTEVGGCCRPVHGL